jgi:hypothetical protein
MPAEYNRADLQLQINVDKPALLIHNQHLPRDKQREGNLVQSRVSNKHYGNLGLFYSECKPNHLQKENLRADVGVGGWGGGVGPGDASRLSSQPHSPFPQR